MKWGNGTWSGLAWVAAIWAGPFFQRVKGHSVFHAALSCASSGFEISNSGHRHQHTAISPVVARKWKITCGLRVFACGVSFSHPKWVAFTCFFGAQMVIPIVMLSAWMAAILVPVFLWSHLAWFCWIVLADVHALGGYGAQLVSVLVSKEKFPDVTSNVPRFAPGNLVCYMSCSQTLPPWQR